MKSHKEHRFNRNPKEQELFEAFKKQFEGKDYTLSAMVFGWGNEHQTQPKDHISEREIDICANLIQWLGSPVGQGFLAECGFVNAENQIKTVQK